MLNPKNNRLDYGSILSPPPNYRLDFAIGATYSLDLDSLIGASISLGLSEEIDSNLLENPIFLLEALRSTGDKVALFCENGQIRAVTKPTKLYILLENIIFQANNYQINKYNSFHPKFWLIRYINSDNILYRVIVLSRNLTFNQSWDITFTMDGVKSELNHKNDALISFINYLKEFTTDSVKASKINEIANELQYVNFDLESEIFTDYDFIVNGIDSKFSIDNYSLFKEDFDELLIISPFLSNDIIKDFNNRLKNKGILITRTDSLSKLNSQDCSNFDIFVLKDEIIDGDDSHYLQKHDIHSKIYITQKDRLINIYLGSLNASHNALNGNVELMIKISSEKLKFDVLVDSIFNGKKDSVQCPFKLIDMENIIDNTESDKDNLDLIIKRIIRLNSKARIINQDNYYTISLQFDNLNTDEFKDYTIKISPLFSNRILDLSCEMLFEKLNKLQLSEFFTIEVNGIKRIFKIPISEMPDGRDSELISEIITDKKDFIKYMAFLLGDDYILTSIENENSVNGNYGSNFSTDLTELYEKMLKASLYSPSKFDELDFIIESLSKENIVPDEFKKLYKVFLEVLGK